MSIHNRFYILLFFLGIMGISPLSSFSQFNISGKIVRSDNGIAIPNASIFINNTTVGTISKADGYFTLANVKPGQYDLVVSCIGLVTYFQKIIVRSDLNVQEIKLSASFTNLKEVKIISIDPNRARYLQLFKRAFLGNNENALDCKILNPEVIKFNFNATTNILNASSDESIIIENNALGYRLYYQLSSFVLDNNKQFLSYEGPVRFELLNGKLTLQKRWVKNRLDVYIGSNMNFLRALYKQHAPAEGFTVYKLIKPSLINDSARRKDSVKFDKRKARLQNEPDYIVKTPLSYEKFALKIDEYTQALRYSDFLMVIYNDESGHFLTKRPSQSTALILNTKMSAFDENGIFIDPTSITFDGDWSKSRVADLLPIDYNPF